MSASAKGKQQKQVRQLQCQEQCIGHIPHYLSGLSRAHFFRQPFSKQLYARVKYVMGWLKKEMTSNQLSPLEIHVLLDLKYDLDENKNAFKIVMICYFLKLDFCFRKITYPYR